MDLGLNTNLTENIKNAKLKLVVIKVWPINTLANRKTINKLLVLQDFSLIALNCKICSRSCQIVITFCWIQGFFNKFQNKSLFGLSSVAFRWIL